MHYLVWLARFLVFVLVLLFALNNLTPVDVRLYGEHVFAGVPLVLVMLAAFFLGTVLGSATAPETLAPLAPL